MTSVLLAMASDDTEAKTEEPSARKWREARARGEVARSPVLAAAVVTAAGIGLVAWQLGAAGARVAAIARRSFAAALEPDLDAERLTRLLAAGVAEGAHALVPLLLVLTLFAFLASFLQVGPLWTVDPWKPRLDRIEFAAGVRRALFGAETWGGAASRLVQLGAIVAVLWALVGGRLRELASLTRLEPAAAFEWVVARLGPLAAWSAALLLAVALVDWLWCRARLARSLRMSPREKREEARLEEGDPTLRGERLALHREILESGRLERARAADGLVYGDGFACALRYDPARDPAPRVLAKGRGALAERLADVARAEGIPLVHDPRLAARLAEVAAEEPIPAELDEPVGDVLRWLEEVARAGGRAVAWRPEPDEASAN